MSPCPHAVDARLAACPACLLEAPIPAARIGNDIELGPEIGRGGMGAVHRGRHMRLGRDVAVKLLPPELAGDPESIARFDREARAMAMLNHPNIVAVHDVGREEGQPYLVMEFVEGRPVSAMLPLPVPRAVSIALQVCDALSYAHGRGVVHRDVKPENILVDAGGRAKVTDFGIARLVGPDLKGATVTGHHEVLGTPHYMAPEALAGAAPDPRMDVYSVGVLLHQMVTGRLPIGTYEPAPSPIDAIVRRALVPDPARRYASVAELRRDLELGQGGGPAELPPDEMTWLRAVALLQAVSTGVALWAFLECIQPKVLAPGEAKPLIMVFKETLPDGRILSRARFETPWVLAAVATFALAIVPYGLLRRHWRLAGLQRDEPDRPVPDSRRVFYAGLFAVAVYGVRKAIEAGGGVAATQWMPVIGGAIELAVLFLFWVAVLQTWRRGRPLRREPLLWLGLVLALIPPASDLLAYLAAWQPT